MGELDEPRRPAQAQHLHEQIRESHEMALAKVGDRAKVRPVQPGHRHHVDPLFAGTGELTGRVQARL